MATYGNNLRLKEITTGDEDGTWGTSTNTNLELITDGFSSGTKQLAGDANETFTMPDGTADSTRGFYLKITSAVALTSSREVTLGPNLVSKVWLIENATTGGQSIIIKQGSGAGVTIPTTQKSMVVSDGAGAGAAVVNASPSVNLQTDVSGTLPPANGGTGLTAPGAAGNVLKSDGTAWTSAASAAGYPAPSLIATSATVASSTFQVVTAGGITITLPATPTAGDFVAVKDGTGAAATTNFTVAGNGSNIASSATNLTFDKNFAEIVMTYIDATIGWSV